MPGACGPHRGVILDGRRGRTRIVRKQCKDAMRKQLGGWEVSSACKVSRPILNNKQRNLCKPRRLFPRLLGPAEAACRA